MSKIVYKVVGIAEDNSMVSICYFFRAPNSAVTYSIGERAQPHIAKSALYAFENEQLAREFGIKMLLTFMCSVHSIAILRCEARLSKARAQIVPSIIDSYIARFWAKEIIETKAAPNGTVMCASVLPKEVVTKIRYFAGELYYG